MEISDYETMIDGKTDKHKQTHVQTERNLDTNRVEREKQTDSNSVAQIDILKGRQ